MEGTPKKRVVRKRVKITDKNIAVVKRKNAVTKKVPRTVLRSQPIRKKPAAKSFLDSEPEELTLVTGPLSQRLQEKRKIYEDWFANKSPALLRPVALTSGYAYIVAGILLSIFIIEPFNFETLKHSAALGCASTYCADLVSEKVEMISPLPEVIFSPLPKLTAKHAAELLISIKYADIQKLELIALTMPGAVVLNQGIENDGLYKYELPAEKLNPGTYLLKATVVSAASNKTVSVYLSPVFTVAPEAGGPEIESTNVTIEPQGEVLGLATSTAIIDQSNESFIATSTATETEEVVKSSEVKEEETNFSFSATTNAEQNQTIFKIKPIFAYDSVVLFAKPAQSNELLVLGQATAVGDDWYFWLENNDLPNGDYDIVIEAYEDSTLKAEAAFDFINPISNLSTISTLDLEKIVSSVQTELGTSEDTIALQEQRASYMTDYLINLPDNADNKVLSELFTPSSALYDELLFKFAATLQTKDDALRMISESKLHSAVDDQVGTTEDRTIVKKVMAFLSKTKDLVIQSELEYSNISELKSMTDQDHDGIADYDEVVTFKTDPSVPDTDVDGFTDGIEIVGGYNPLSEESEATYFTDYSSSIIEPDQSIFISSVEPVHMYQNGTTTPQVLSMLNGKATPNSYVKIIFASEKLAAITRVSRDGTFSYLLNYELTNGDYEVKLVYTDNSGKIIKQSPVFSFNRDNNEIAILSASAFAVADNIASTGQEKKIFLSQNLIGAIGVISFGLILLLLGKALPKRKITAQAF